MSISVLALVKDGLVILLACAVLAGTALSLYLFLLAIASLRRPKLAGVQSAPSSRFAILIPAHEEELVIGRLIGSINELDYPRELYTVHVIADHCSDRTASIARSLNATVYERNDPDPRGKSWSLNWLVKLLLAGQSEKPLDAFVVLDADSIVSSNFLRAMDVRLHAGSPLIQGLIQIDDPGTGSIEQLRALAYEFISHLRPLGRSALGLSAGLRGNGMCITCEYAAKFPWNPESLTEDYELHGRLVVAGLRVAYAPDAIVLTQLPHSLASVQTQSQRWERGRLETMKHLVPTLLAQGLRKRSWLCIDGALELLIPPFSILMALMLVFFALSLISGVGPLILVALIGLVAQCLYTLRGLVLASTRYPHIYRALLFVPVFVMWRLWQYLSVLTKRGPAQWIRTVRTPPQ